MKKELFADLVSSVLEAGKIHRGEAKPSRRFMFKAENVRRIREKLHKSQSEFARMIGVSVSTLQNWEQGRREPKGPARALLVLAALMTEEYLEARAKRASRRKFNAILAKVPDTEPEASDRVPAPGRSRTRRKPGQPPRTSR